MHVPFLMEPTQWYSVKLYSTAEVSLEVICIFRLLSNEVASSLTAKKIAHVNQFFVRLRRRRQ